jgi:hypothetical protein
MNFSRPIRAEGALVSRLPNDLGGWSIEPTKDDAFMDVERIQRRINAMNQRYGSLRIHTGCYRAPWPVTPDNLARFHKAAVDKWVAWQEKEGFTLRSKVRVTGPYTAYETSGDWYSAAILDMREFRVSAMFSTNAKPVRLELPVHRIKDRRDARPVGA